MLLQSGRDLGDHQFLIGLTDFTQLARSGLELSGKAAFQRGLSRDGGDEKQENEDANRLGDHEMRGVGGRGGMPSGAGMGVS